jgi:sphingosine kinase
MPVDLFSVTQEGNRSFSFMTQCVGLMAELDLGTEHLRWMGDTRFTVGFLRGCQSYHFPASCQTTDAFVDFVVVTMKSTPVTLSMKIAQQDKEEMVAALNSARAQPLTYGDAPAESSREAAAVTNGDIAGLGAETALPPLRYSTDEDGWTTFDKPLLYVYAGQSPFVSR